MADDRPARVDEAVVREHMEEVIESHEQAFETFFFARFLGLNFEYLPAEAPDADKEVCRLTFEVTDMLRNPQGSLHGGVMASAMDISMGHLVNKIAGAGAKCQVAPLPLLLLPFQVLQKLQLRALPPALVPRSERVGLLPIRWCHRISIHQSFPRY